MKILTLFEAGGDWVGLEGGSVWHFPHATYIFNPTTNRVNMISLYSIMFKVDFKSSG